MRPISAMPLPANGSYKVTLKAYNADAACFGSIY